MGGGGPAGPGEELPQFRSDVWDFKPPRVERGFEAHSTTFFTIGKLEGMISGPLAVVQILGFVGGLGGREGPVQD